MYLKVELGTNNWVLKLVRIGNIQSSNYKFNQKTHGTDGPMTLEYAIPETGTKFAKWSSTENSLINISV